MLGYHLGTVNDFHWRLKPVFRYSKHHTYSTFIEEENENQIFLHSLPSPPKTIKMDKMIGR